MGVPGRGFFPLVIIGPQYNLLIVKGDKKGQRSKAVWKELLWASRTLNYHNKQTLNEWYIL